MNIHNDERILKNFSVLSRGWHDFQQVRHLFIFLVWWYLLSSNLCWGCSSNRVVVGVVPQYSRKQNVVEDFVFEAPKTKDFVAMTKNLKVSDKKLLVILPEANKNVYLSARNIEGANVQTVSGLNTYRVLNAGVVVLTENSLKAIDNILI